MMLSITHLYSPLLISACHWSGEGVRYPRGYMAQFQGTHRIPKDAAINPLPVGAEQTAPRSQGRSELAIRQG